MIIGHFNIFFIVVFCVVYPIWTQHLSRRPLPLFRDSESNLTLPNNATAIRENIVDTFSCENRIYGYYADIDNECQIFHVCLPQARGARRWSFICPAETVFNQATFVCTRINESIPCEESEQYYELNEEIGKEEDKEDNNNNNTTENPEINPEENPAEESGAHYPQEFDSELPTPIFKSLRGKGKSKRRGKSEGVENDKSNSTAESMKSEKSSLTRRQLRK